MELYVRHSEVKARVRDGTKLFTATRYDDGIVDVCAADLRDAARFDGSSSWHWTKPTVDGKIVAHASRAFWRDGTLAPAPAAEGEEDTWVDLLVLMRPEAVQALAQGLRRAGRGVGTADVTELPRSST